MKARSLAVALFVAAAVLYGGLLALYMGSLQAAAGITLYACVAASFTAAVFGERLHQRATSSNEPANGLLDGAGVTALAYVLGVLIMAGLGFWAAPYNGFFGFVAVGLMMGVFFLPPALIFGALAGLVFRLVVSRGAV